MYQWGLENQAALDEMEHHARSHQESGG
jgi:hypothetical protein